MLDRFLSLLRDLKTALEAKQRAARELSPQALAKLAEEVRQLADVADRLEPVEDAFKVRLARIRDEMDQLGRLASKPEFQRLSEDKRQKLREGLLASRKQLMESVQSAPAPTDRLQ